MNFRFFFLLLVLFCACSGNKDRSKLLASVDQERITAKMVQDRLKISKIYYPNSDLMAARIQLIRAFVFKKILENNGMKITQTELLNESERIEKNSKDRKTLEKIQSNFERNSPEYLQLFVLPTLTERSIYQYFLNNDLFHENAKKPALDFLSAAKNAKSGIDFKRIAKSKSQNALTAKINSDGIIWNFTENKKTDANTASAQNEQLDQFQREFEQSQVRLWSEEILPKIKNNSVFPELISLGDHWFVVQKIAKDRFHYIAFPKADFDEWLETEKRRVTVLEHNQKEF